MKLKDIDRLLKDNGFVVKRVTGHIIYSNGKRHVSIPNHKEVNDMIIRRLLKENNLHHLLEMI